MLFYRAMVLETIESADEFGIEAPVDDAVVDTDLVRTGENEGHPSMRSLVDGECEIITF